MNTYLRIAVVFSLIALSYGCQTKIAHKPTSETTEATLPSNEITITQDGQAISTAQSATLASAASESHAAPATNLLENTSQATPDAPLESPTPKNIQLALFNAGLYKGKVDGSIGPKTKKAIREFQEQNGLRADGKVGAKTWTKLQTHLSQPSDNSTTEQKD